MKKKVYSLATILMLTSGAFAQIPTNGLIFEHHFEGDFVSLTPLNALIDSNASYNYALGEDVNGNADNALELFIGDGNPSLVYNNVVNDLQTTNANNQGITMYCNAKLDSAFLVNLPINTYISILYNGQQFIRLQKTNQLNPYTIQFGVLDGNTELGTYGYTVTAQSTSLEEITQWKGYALTYYTNANGGVIDGYFGNYVQNHLEVPSSVGLTFGPADTSFYIGTNIQQMAFQGWIDDVLIYERALSELEIENMNTFYGTAALKEDQLLNLTLYPNPSAEFLHLSTDQSVEYNITSVNGATVKAGTLDANESLSIQTLEKGQYFIAIEQNGKRQIIPFVKN
jgi:hypothetical protein